MKSCKILAQTKNKNGEVVQSKLFKDLLQYTNQDRKKATQLYRIAKDPKFLELAGDVLQYDENGEVTVKSLIDVTGDSFSEDSVIKKLNKEIGAGEYSFEAAISKLVSFNKDNPWNKDYMATLTRKGDKYELSVVKRTQSQENQLNKVVKHQSLKDRLTYYLQQSGVAVDFIDGPDSRYTTENIDKAADGLYHLIKVSRGSTTSTEFAEEAGHFAVGAMSSSPLVERLMSLLSEDVQRSILGESYDSKILGKNPRREVAGVLVGKALSNNLDTKSPIGKLAHRIAQTARRIFARLSGDQVKLDVLKAEEYAEQIANNLISSQSTLSAEEAIKTQETLYSSEKSKETKKYNEAIKSLQRAYKELSSIKGQIPVNIQQDENGNISVTEETEEAKGQIDQVLETINTILDNMVGEEGSTYVTANSSNTIYSIQASLVAMGNGIDLLYQYLTLQLPQYLSQIDLDNTKSFIENMALYSTQLRAAEAIYKTAMEINSSLATIVKNLGNNPKVSFRNANGQMEVINLSAIHESMAEVLNVSYSGSLYAKLREKQKQYFSKFLANVYGEKYVNKSSKIVYKKKGIGLQVIKGIENMPSEDYFRELIDSIDEGNGDMNFFDYMLSWSGISPNEIIQVADMANTMSKHVTNQRMKSIQERIEVIRQQIEDLGIDPEIFYERAFYPEDSDGDGDTMTYTGNFISPAKVGEWEYARNKMIAILRKEFEETIAKEEGFDLLPGRIKSAKWQEFSQEAIYEWHKRNSVKDENGRWIPKTYDNVEEIDLEDVLYDNTSYWELSPEERSLLGEIRNLKEELDSCVQGHGVSYRIPQFKASFIERVANRRRQNQKGALLKSLREVILEEFCEDAEDYEYGSQATYQDGEDMFETNITRDYERVNRIPLFGINKLSKKVEVNGVKVKIPDGRLSTDICHCLMAYASMALSYDACTRFVDALEIGRNILSQYGQKKLGKGITSGIIVSKKDRLYCRYQKFLEMNVYQLAQNIASVKIGSKKVILNKLADFLSNMTSLAFLGFHHFGAGVNLGTALIDVYKMAAVGDHFTKGELLDAAKEYLKGALGIVSAMDTDNGVGWKPTKEGFIPGFLTNEDKGKAALFLRKMDAHGDNEYYYRSWHGKYRKFNSIIKVLRGIPMFGYSTGDHIIQALPYIAIAKHRKIYDQNGKSISAWDSYKVIEEDLVSENGEKLPGNRKIQRLEQDQQYYKIPNGQAQFDILQSIRQKFESYMQPNIFGANTLSLSEEEIDFLVANNIVKAVNEETPVDNQRVIDMLFGDNYTDTLGQLKLVEGNILWGEEDVSIMAKEALTVSDQMNGVYRRTEKGVIHSNLITKLFTVMRNYAVGRLHDAFAGNRDVLAYKGNKAKNFEGKINTLIKMNMAMFSKDIDFGMLSIIKSMAFLIPGVMDSRWGQKTRLEFQDAGFSEGQVDNMKAIWIYLLICGVLSLLNGLTDIPEEEEEELEKKLSEKSEELKKQLELEGHSSDYINEKIASYKKVERDKFLEKKKKLGWIHYYIHRLGIEQMSYILIHEMIKELKSLGNPGGIAPFGFVGNMLELLYYGAGALFTDYHGRTPEIQAQIDALKKSDQPELREKGKLMEQKYKQLEEEYEDTNEKFYYSKNTSSYSKGDSKFKVKASSYLPLPNKNKKIIQDGYEAADSFDFYRNK